MVEWLRGLLPLVAFKTLNPQHYSTTNNELFAVVTAMELFMYYLSGRYFTVVTDHPSLT